MQSQNDHCNELAQEKLRRVLTALLSTLGDSKMPSLTDLLNLDPILLEQHLRSSLFRFVKRCNINRTCSSKNNSSPSCTFKESTTKQTFSKSTNNSGVSASSSASTSWSTGADSNTTNEKSFTSNTSSATSYSFKVQKKSSLFGRKFKNQHRTTAAKVHQTQAKTKKSNASIWKAATPLKASTDVPNDSQTTEGCVPHRASPTCKNRNNSSRVGNNKNVNQNPKHRTEHEISAAKRKV